ncbi:MAG: nucleotidyltransferase domain-containing protein [Candidatus Aenigmarchaeota archaeon]|nr:nucleotidyltransferase domain-containing protein [Candidatus Aenigmarchaeota archaeon]MDI6723003.1 nucleotidyltransferase domain-containing protein [Candidatus Aenigmarchaeota archaeon]
MSKFEAVIFGSYADNNFTPLSDIDIAIITRETDPKKNANIWKNALRKAKSVYHINIFELLPLHVKSGIMDNYIVVFGDRLEISEYFYHFRNLWDDEKHRCYSNQFGSLKEKMKKMNISASAPVLFFLFLFYHTSALTIQ